MSHFRDRVITSGNLPQLPSGKRAAANVPILTSQVVVATLVVDNHTITPPTVSLASLIVTQTKTATSP